MYTHSDCLANSCRLLTILNSIVRFTNRAFSRKKADKTLDLAHGQHNLVQNKQASVRYMFGRSFGVNTQVKSVHETWKDASTPGSPYAMIGW